MQCGYFDAGICRSCTLMGIPYAEQLAAKDARSRELLAAWPGILWAEPVASREDGFRNKAKMVVGGSVEDPTLGILDDHRHGVDLTGCGVCAPGLREAFPALAAFVTRAGIPPYDVPTRRGELKHLLITESPDGELMVRFVLRSTEALGRIRKHLPALQAELPRLRVVSANLLPAHAALLEGEEEIPLTAERALPMRMDAAVLPLHPGAFFQTNTAIAQELYRQAAAWLADTSAAEVWDLYCGVGGFALHVAAPGRRVLGIEVSPEAVASARDAAAAAGLDSVRFAVGDATRVAVADAAPDAVIVNPPRRGLGAELCAALDASGAATIVYSSCNPVTLAADLERLPAYAPLQARVFDMFPQTEHQEVMVLLERR